MDFFEAQDRARSKTKTLVALFVLATLATCAAIYMAVTVILALTDDSPYFEPWNGERAAWILVLTTGIVASCSAWKAARLSGGGSSVAEMLGGQRAPAEPTEPKLQRLRNVVEEMAIAAGCRVPEVFVLPHEEGINAFAAGYTLDNAAIAVSQGCLDQLDREELQGVVAHEFSHILNGDMRINTRLVSVIFGILAIAVIGRLALQLVGGGRRRHVYAGSSRRSKGGGAIAVILLIAVAVMIIGYIGVLFGRMIQSAVSRQREYLADAAAVQFTRNPSGISNALRKIGRAARGSRVAHPDAEEVGHMFFAQALKSAFATHPPLEKRIQAIDPSGLYAKPIEARAETKSPEPAGVRPRSDFVSSIARQPILGAAVAAELLARIPADTVQAAHDPQKAFATLAAGLDPESVALAGRRLAPGERFALIELSLAALKHLPPEQAAAGMDSLQARALADGSVTIDEQCILLAARRNMEDSRRNANGRLILFPQARADIEILLTAVALADAPSEAAARGAFEQAQSSFRGFAATLRPDFQAARDPRRLNAAIENAGVSIFNVRKAVIDAASRIAASDDLLSEREQTLIRSLCLALGVPLPR